MSYRDIRTERSDGVGHLVLARLDRNNAVTHHMLEEVCAGLDELIGDETVKAIVVRAEGKNFCAGADFEYLDGLTSIPSSMIESDIYAHFQGAARRLYHCPKPTVAAVNGAAVTVGCELTLACDFRIVAGDASFREAWIHLGLMPPLGGLFLLPRIIGLARASQVVLRGEPIDADHAVDWGLALEKVDLDQLLPRSVALARELGALPANAYAVIKQGLHRGLETTMEAEWSANVSKQALLIGAPQFRSALEDMKRRRPKSFAQS